MDLDSAVKPSLCAVRKKAERVGQGVSGVLWRCIDVSVCCKKEQRMSVIKREAYLALQCHHEALSETAERNDRSASTALSG
ncbi:hypothetical protein NDU88_012289 [Pleurodeles waltl]|uniref:Uncharacterized protein n=1 Tax=Pleurodeles waltl TaxID=8319 RepID=A0AAV7QZP9_PLEWA|nr:hypothetical protein NDU88_012289 [Pleurodeles waltl]